MDLFKDRRTMHQLIAEQIDAAKRELFEKRLEKDVIDGRIDVLCKRMARLEQEQQKLAAVKDNHTDER